MLKGEKDMKRRLRAAYTVEAAGVMATVFFTVMLIIRVAFSLNAEVVGIMKLHREVEVERHAVSNMDETEIARSDQGNGWSMNITAPVFRPEKSLRMWSLAEESS